MRYRKPATEIEAVQWTGDNMQEIWDRLGADNVYGPTAFNKHPILTPDGGAVRDGIPLTAVGEWIIGNRVDDGWYLARLTDDEFRSLDLKPAYRDRTEHYVPEGLYLDGKPQYAEISPAREISPRTLRHLVDVAAMLLTGAWARFDDMSKLTGAHIDVAPIREWLAMLDDWTGPDQEHPARYARIAHGSPDEQNRDSGHWWWADVSGDGTHWSHFGGHRMQVDLKLSTANSHDVHEWKGRDDIRPGGHWELQLNRQPMGDGYIGVDVHRTLQKIGRTLEKLADHPALDHSSATPYAEQLAGRRVYYQRHPAVVSGEVLQQGCVILAPVGAPFPKAVYNFDAEGTEGDTSDAYERRTVKVELDSPDIWWHRHRAFGDELPIPRGPVEADDDTQPVTVPGTLQVAGFEPQPPADGPDGTTEAREATDEGKESES